VLGLATALGLIGLLGHLIKIPMLSLHLGQEDVGATPETTTERQAFDLLAARYGPGYNGPLVTAVRVNPPAHPSQVYEDKYNQAKANQAELERKQAQLQDQKRQLQQEQAQLLAQQAALRH
jgi:septal ring factor EnvC (AmiA/AmiB activator)